MKRLGTPRKANTERNWRVYRAVVVDGMTYSEAVRTFGVNRKRIYDILAWCRKQPEHRGPAREVQGVKEAETT